MTGSGGTRYATLDAWRGLACLGVVVHHAGYAVTRAEAQGSWARWLTVMAVRRMDLGVTLFFVISGYCIAASLDAARHRGESAASFLGRRFWRIYPPYWVALASFAVVVAALDAAGLSRWYNGPLGVRLDPPGALDGWQWLGNLGLFETWRPYVAGSEQNVFTGVAWSLCYEEQFYMVTALVLWLVPGRAVKALALVTLAAGALRLGAAWGGCDLAFRGTFPRLWHEFAVGMAVYYALNRAPTAGHRRATAAGLAVLLLAGLWFGGRGTATAAGFGLVLFGLHRWDARIDAVAWLEPLRQCGRRCYSIYLAHLPLGVAVNHALYDLGVSDFWGRMLVMIPIGTAVGVACGWAFHAAVEAHFLKPPPWAKGRLSLGWRPHRQISLGGPVGST